MGGMDFFIMKLLDLNPLFRLFNQKNDLLLIWWVFVVVRLSRPDFGKKFFLLLL